MPHPINPYYPVQVWAFSIFLGPAIIPIQMLWVQDYGEMEAGLFGLYVLFFFIGFIFSIPSAVLSCYLFWSMESKNISATLLKSMHIFFVFILLFTTFAALGMPLHQMSDPEGWTLPGSYSFFFLLGTLLFKVERKKQINR